jgi:succinyl-diaminopimelate desuccinylase
MITSKDLIKLTRKLITFKTVRPDNISSGSRQEADFIRELNKCINYITHELHVPLIIDRGEEYVTDISAPILIAKFYDTKEPAFLIIGHIDVVDGEDSQFQPYEKCGRIYGRGSKDMKAGVAAMIAIMNHYAAYKIKPNIAVAFVSDEEIGGYNGANLIINKMGYHPRSVLSPDPGEEHCIINREKGFIWFSFTVFGKSAHPSRPWLGDNAMEKVYRIWNLINAEFNLSSSEKDWKPSACLVDAKKVVINADETISPDSSAAVPAAVYCRADIRYTENDNPEKIIKRLEEIIKQPDGRNKFEIHSIGPVCYTPSEAPFIQNFKQACDSVEGYSLQIQSSAGASDLRFFSEKKIPCINFGPDGKNHHAKDEYVDIESIKKFCELVINYIDSYL